MSAANTDKLRKNAPNFATTLAGSISPTDTTIPLQSVTGLPLDTAVCMTIDATDVNNMPTPTIKEAVIGVVNTGSVSLVNCLRGVEGTAQAHNSGAFAVGWFTAADWNDVITAFLVQHNQAGAHQNITTDTLTTSGDLTVGGNILGNGVVPSGVMFSFGGTSIPTGYLLCDGSSVLRASYPLLFSAIGTNYGSVDGTHFTLPDRRGRFGVGKNSGTFAALGATGGEETHILTTGEMPAHNHDFQGFATATTSVPYTGTQGWQVGGGTFTGPSAIQNTGGGAAHNNLPPYLTSNYIIKT